MINLQELQRKIYQNKVNRNFNVTDVGKEIVLMVEELGELANAYKRSDQKPAPDISEKVDMVDAIGDLMIYCLGLCEMLEVDSEDVLQATVTRNENRSHEGWMQV
ncbi:MAG: MazG nucleotide pyrophosphohydrolase domain-containing protein [Anaerolineae bacterium]|nr:MazG nucleotide pyrophosphohydrolase domain-containing protein [Anaerolineae bacterium]